MPSDQSPSTNHQGQQFVLELLDLCLREDGPSFTAVLERIVAEFNAFGCIVWERFPCEELDKSRGEDTLFTLASWFPEGNALMIADLPVNGSVSGHALKMGSPVCVHNVQIEGGPKLDHPYLMDNRIGPVCAIPFRFHDKREGTFDLLRTFQQGTFNHHEIESLAVVVQHIPQLYRARRERLSLELIQATNKIFQNVQWPQVLENGGMRVIDTSLDLVCNEVAKSRKALEVSIILNDAMASFGRFQLRATTWDQFPIDRYKKYDLEEWMPGEIHPIDRKTEWVIRNSAPILLLDLANSDSAAIAKRYPGLELQENQIFLQTAIQKIKQVQERYAAYDNPPICYIAVPIQYGNCTLGVIRICGTYSPPHYFPERDVALFELVAGQIAHFWGTWLHLSSHHEQLENVTSLANGISSLNSFVHDQIAKDDPDLTSILQRAVDKICEVIPSAEAVDVRSYDEKHELLRFSVLAGSYWAHQESGAQELIRMTTYAVPEGKLAHQAMSVGEWVIRTRKPYWTANIEKEQYYRVNSFFPERKQAITVPMLAGTHVYGVLDVSTSSIKEFSPHLQKLIELFGTQLGMYYSLIEKIKERQHFLQEIDLRYEELAHQLKGPLGQARERADRIVRLKWKGRENEIRDVEWQAIRGLCRKALGVLRTLAFGSDMRSGMTIKPDLQSLEQSAEYLRTVLEEAAFDYELKYHRSQVEFRVDRDSIRSVFGNNRKMMLDRELFEQVVSIIYDNAIKYSFRSSWVAVLAIRLQSGESCIEVSNRGIPLTSDDAVNCKRRGWRGVEAMRATAEGLGLGLWLADYIMATLGGRIETIPTDQFGWTRIRMVFK